MQSTPNIKSSVQFAVSFHRTLQNVSHRQYITLSDDKRRTYNAYDQVIVVLKRTIAIALLDMLIKHARLSQAMLLLLAKDKLSSLPNDVHQRTSNHFAGAMSGRKQAVICALIDLFDQKQSSNSQSVRQSLTVNSSLRSLVVRFS